MKKFNRNDKDSMLRMFKVIQAICVLYYSKTAQKEEDRQTAINKIFMIAHLFVDSAKEKHEDWVAEILHLENGLIKTEILNQIDNIYLQYKGKI